MIQTAGQKLSICNAMGTMAQTCFGMDSDAARSITCFASDCINFQPPPENTVVGGLAGAAVAPKNTVTILAVAKMDNGHRMIIALPDSLYIPHGAVRVISERKAREMNYYRSVETDEQGHVKDYLLDRSCIA